MMSVAGGWFFLMACEMFVLGDRDFRLPGLGSFLQTAAGNGDTKSVLWGLAAMVGVIVLMDQLIWRPVIVWADKFKFEQVESASQTPQHAAAFAGPRVFRDSHIPHLCAAFREPLDPECGGRSAASDSYFHRTEAGSHTQDFADRARLGDFGGARLRCVSRRARIVGSSPRRLFSFAAQRCVYVYSCERRAHHRRPLDCAGWRRDRIEPKLARIAQPLAQLAASIPATALFPVILLFLIRLRGGLELAALVLMLLGTQWYILFNVIAGAMAIPTDLKEAARIFRFGRWDRWRYVILPGIFPYLVTGMVTASGGAWNASIVAEYFHFQGHIVSTTGLGSTISRASDGGQFDVLLAATLIMAVVVVLINRFVWRRLYRLASTRFKLET